MGQKQLTRYGIFRPARMSMIVKKRKTWGYGDSGISKRPFLIDGNKIIGSLNDA